MDPVTGATVVLVLVVLVFIVCAYKLGFAFGKQEGVLEEMKRSNAREHTRFRERLDELNQPKPPTDFFG